MKIISLSQRKFKDLKKLDLPKEIYNTEATLYDFRYRGKDKVFKRLYHTSGQVFANKLYTLEMLDANREYFPSNFCVPDALLSVGGVIEGATMPKVNGVNLSLLLKNKKVSTETQIYYLKKVGEILNKLKYIRETTPLKDFYINDLHDFNFLADIENKNLNVVDLDSAKIGNNNACAARFLTPFSLLNSAVGKYNINKDENASGYVVADENTDLYCYIIMILNYLYGESINNVDIVRFYDYLNYLESIGVNKELIENFGKILINKDNENPIELLDSITNEQVYRAKKNVYEKLGK